MHPLEAKRNFWKDCKSPPHPGAVFGRRSPLVNKTTIDGYERGVKNISFALVS